MANQVWQCEYCGKIHEEKKYAEDCEGFHIGVEEIKEYEFKSGHNDKYPIVITCLMEDGKTVEFYRERPLFKGDVSEWK